MRRELDLYSNQLTSLDANQFASNTALVYGCPLPTPLFRCLCMLWDADLTHMHVPTHDLTHGGRM